MVAVGVVRIPLVEAADAFLDGHGRAVAEVLIEARRVGVGAKNVSWLHISP